MQGFSIQGILSSIVQHLYQLAGWLQPVVIVVGICCAIVYFGMYEFGEEQHHKAKKLLGSVIFACAGVMLVRPIIQGLSTFFGGFGGGF